MRYMLLIGWLTLFAAVRSASACDPVGPPRFVVEPSIERAPPLIVSASASLRRGDLTDAQICPGLSWLTLGVIPAPTESIGLSIEPMGDDPLSIQSEYQVRLFRVDATGHVRIPFFTDGRALDFGLRLVPVSLSGARGQHIDIRIQEQAVPGFYPFLYRHRGMIQLMVVGAAVALLAAILVYWRLGRRNRLTVGSVPEGEERA